MYEERQVQVPCDKTVRRRIGGGKPQCWATRYIPVS